MFRSKKKLREQLQFEKEQNIALRNALQSEKRQTQRYHHLFENTKTAHQELRQQYGALQLKYFRAIAPEVVKKKSERR